MPLQDCPCLSMLMCHAGRARTQGLSWNRSAPFVSRKGYKHQTFHIPMGQGPPSSYLVWGEAHPPLPPICLVLLEEGNSKSKSQEAPGLHTRLQVRTKDKMLWPRPGNKLPCHTLSVFIVPTLFWNLLPPYPVPSRLWCCGFIKDGGKWGYFACVRRPNATDLSYRRLSD